MLGNNVRWPQNMAWNLQEQREKFFKKWVDIFILLYLNTIVYKNSIIDLCH